jgi:hypothetical protein
VVEQIALEVKGRDDVVIDLSTPSKSMKKTETLWIHTIFGRTKTHPSLSFFI